MEAYKKLEENNSWIYKTSHIFYNPVGSLDEQALKNDYDKKLNNDKWKSFSYIKNFFKQNEEKEDIIEKEKKLAKECLKLLIESFENISQIRNYSLADCLVFAFALYQTNLMFSNINLTLEKSINLPGFEIFCKIRYLNERYSLDDKQIFINQNLQKLTIYDFLSKLFKILNEKDYSYVENESAEIIDSFFKDLTENEETSDLDEKIMELKKLDNTRDNRFNNEFMSLSKEEQIAFFYFKGYGKQFI